MKYQLTIWGYCWLTKILLILLTSCWICWNFLVAETLKPSPHDKILMLGATVATIPIQWSLDTNVRIQCSCHHNWDTAFLLLFNENNWLDRSSITVGWLCKISLDISLARVNWMWVSSIPYSHAILSSTLLRLSCSHCTVPIQWDDHTVQWKLWVKFTFGLIIKNVSNECVWWTYIQANNQECVDWMCFGAHTLSQIIKNVSIECVLMSIPSS